jgi:hypothetical protein
LATPIHNSDATAYFQGGSYAGSGIDFHDTGMMGDGDWHEWKFYIKMNSSEGTPNGEFKFWQDNKLVTEEKSLAWQDDGAKTRKMWNYIMLGGNNFNKYANKAAQLEQWYAIDDFVISTSDIPSEYIQLKKEG